MKLKHRLLWCVLSVLGLFPERVIRDPAGSPYLTRWTLLRLFGRAVYVHRMHAPDYARELHDHPWRFATLILAGGYQEEFRRGDGLCSRWNGPLRIRVNPARHMHRVSDLPNGDCWTLVLRGKTRRVWGFETECGWMDWRTYVDRVYSGQPACGDERAEHTQVSRRRWPSSGEATDDRS